jgi:hypothetical protein
MKTFFEYLECIFYNGIWFVCGALMYFPVKYGFEFVGLPVWLAAIISAAIAFWGGLILMATYIEFSNKQLDLTTRKEHLHGLLTMYAMVFVACGVAIATYFLGRDYFEDEDLKLAVFAAGGLSFMLIISVWLNVMKRRDALAEQKEPLQ